jgi:alkylation response protein AidB-like acyl-CoA dehydrogenase
MLLALTEDQEFFRSTTARYLAEKVPPETLRAMRDDPVGFDWAYWRQGADLGWTSLLVAEERGGGSISDQGLIDLGLLAYEFGRCAAPGPLVGTNVVAKALSDSGPAHDAALKELLAGESTAAWCVGEPAPIGQQVASAPLRLDVDGEEVTLQGSVTPVEYAETATYLLVSATDGGGCTTQLLVPRLTNGIEVVPIGTVDLTRRYATVSLQGVRLPRNHVVGIAGEADDAVERQQLIALVLDSVEALGAMDAAFAMTLQWTSDRYSFGRPLASYQALKHRMADMKAWLEAGHAICEAALAAVAREDRGAFALASAAKAFVGQYGSELVHDCVQMHGGIGLTFEHDLHLFLRRHTVIRALRGTPAHHRQTLARLIGVGMEAQ